MIEFQCPACNKQVVLPEEEAGKKHTSACGNVNLVPEKPAPPGAATPAGAATAPSATMPETVYQGRPSQLENLWLFLGLVVVVILCLWPIRRLLGTIFKTSNWDWGVALILILAYVAWLALRILKLKCTTYTVTAENILIEHGILIKNVDNIDLFRVRDVNMSQSILQRVLGIGSIHIESSDCSMPSALLKSIPDPRPAFEKVRKASVAADIKRGVVQIER